MLGLSKNWILRIMGKSDNPDQTSCKEALCKETNSHYIENGWKIVLQWIKSHVDISGNEEVDTLSKIKIKKSDQYQDQETRDQYQEQEIRYQYQDQEIRYQYRDRDQEIRDQYQVQEIRDQYQVQEIRDQYQVQEIRDQYQNQEMRYQCRDQENRDKDM
ncbi:hypothetical protein CDAR_500881 [Caerostris darwini]|uniref:RNase H type-1 domain-containing protein n=1 Tax=Caerostris darwini TaxID=1538125 RepID=A0AAV4NKD0_9ARAC|nr:hypothetical protein CDAR_500881 [Caerostris darwini]